MTAEVVKTTDAPAVASVRDFLFKNRSKLEATLRSIPYERFANVILNAMRRTPKLQECLASSLVHCIGLCAELGLEPNGPLGHAYLVPFFDKKQNGTVCQLIIGYRGYLHLLYRNGSLKHAEAHIVYDNEVASGDFVLVRGITTELKHTVRFDKKRGKPVGAYCVLHFTNGGVHVEPMTWDEIQKVKNGSKARDAGPWVDWEEEMAKKTTVKRGIKWAPTGQDDDMSKAMENDYDTIDAEKVTEAAAPALPSETNLQAPQIDATDKAKAAVAAAQGDLADQLKNSIQGAAK